MGIEWENSQLKEEINLIVESWMLFEKEKTRRSSRLSKVVPVRSRASKQNATVFPARKNAWLGTKWDSARNYVVIFCFYWPALIHLALTMHYQMLVLTRDKHVQRVMKFV